MKRWISILLVLAFAGGAGAMMLPNTVTLPIRVIGPDGTTQSITIDGSSLSSADSISIEGHQIDYPSHYKADRGYTVDKVSVRFNSGSWTNLVDVGVCDTQLGRKLNCLTGPQHTKTVKAAVSDIGGTLSDGANQLEFRLNWPTSGQRNADAPGDVSTSFRILGVEVYDTNGNNLLDNTSFVFDDPGTSSNFQIPSGYNDADSISQGQALWTTRDTLIDYWNGPAITAACADCHHESGEDLRYFGYGNSVIVGRSEFHGLSESEGKKVAAYIRNVGLEHPDTGTSYDPPGRPWHAPYQPGTTWVSTRTESDPRTAGQPLTDIDPIYWAAGAGEDWVLDHDSDMLPFMFPGGVSIDDIHPDSNLNPRTVPVAFQMPDWNEWLPEQHPIDTFGSDFVDGYDGQDPWGYYEEDSYTFSYDNFKDCYQNQGGLDGCRGDAQNALENIANAAESMKERIGPDQLVSGTEYESWDARYSIKRWMAVKEWELIHDYDLMDEQRTIVNQDASRLAWPSQTDDIFSHASHVTADGELKGSHSEGLHNLYFDTGWYDLQVIINNGRGLSTGQGIVDWKYQHPHLEQQALQANTPQGLRYTRSFVVLMQMANLDYPMFNGDKFPEQWKLRHVQLPWLTRYPLSELNNYQSGLYGEVWSEVARAWYLGAVVGNDWANYCREGGKNCIEPETYDPEILTWWGPSNASDYASRLMTHVDKMADASGVDASVTDSLRDWGASLWPDATNPTWGDLLTYNSSTGPSFREVLFGQAEENLRFPGYSTEQPNFVVMGASPNREPNSASVTGNFRALKFYGAAPPNTTADSAITISADSTIVAKFSGVPEKWQSYGYLWLGSDTTNTADGCRLESRGSLSRRAVRMFCPDAGGYSATYYPAPPVSLRVYKRGGYLVGGFRGVNQTSFTLIDSVDISAQWGSLPDTLRAAAGVQNMMPGTVPVDSTVQFEIDSNWGFIQKQ